MTRGQNWVAGPQCGRPVPAGWQVRSASDQCQHHQRSSPIAAAVKHLYLAPVRELLNPEYSEKYDSVPSRMRSSWAACGRDGGTAAGAAAGWLLSGGV